MSEFTADGTDRTTTLKISGLTCEHCVAHVTEELEALPGVKNVSVILNKGGQSVATVVSDVVLDDAALAAAVDEAGDYVLDAVERSDAGRHVLRDGRAERAARSGEEDLDVHDGAVDADQVGGHHVDVGDGAADLGVDDLREGIHDHVD